MVVNDELIACYVDGTATKEERDEVRRYLAVHPEEYELVLTLMEKDRFMDCIPENEFEAESSGNVEECFFSQQSDFTYSAAAFVPNTRQSKKRIIVAEDKKDLILNNLNEMLEEIKTLNE